MAHSIHDTIAQQVVHVRFEGRSMELPLASLHLNPWCTNRQVKEAVAASLDRDAAALAGHVVERTDQAIIVRPEAIYG
jgi:hypothetical protein